MAVLIKMMNADDLFGNQRKVQEVINERNTLVDGLLEELGRVVGGVEGELGKYTAEAIT